MSDYIKREDAEKILFDADISMSEYDRTLKEVEQLPSIDIVKCKDCKHKEHCFSMVHMYIKNQRDVINRDIDYCSYGERKK